jgi:hypothetical protein
VVVAVLLHLHALTRGFLHILEMVVDVDTVEEMVITHGVGYFANFLQERGIDHNALLSEIVDAKSHLFQPRDAHYMKYRGNELKRTKAFVYDGDLDNIPIYVYPGFVYESVLHYSTCDEYGDGLLIQVKDALEKYLEQKINHIIITMYDQPNDCIGWHNDKVSTIADNSEIAVISLGAARRFQIRATPTHKGENPPVLREIVTESGSFIGMSYDANMKYQHSVETFDASRGDEEGSRVSIVFRHIKNILDSNQIDEKVATYHANVAKRAEKKQTHAIKKQAKKGAV